MPPKNVGMIGLGIMGSAMSSNLLKSGFQVTGFDIIAERMRALERAGGEAAENCESVALRTAAIITSLPTADALIDTSKLLATAAQSGSVVIETSTLPIAAKEEARKHLAVRGVALLDCPLSGTGAQARLKDLIVYASGDENAYKRATEILDGFARAHYYVGEFGAGSKMKFIANLLVAIHNVAAAEAMVLAMKAGLDPAMVLKAIADGAGASRMLQVRGPMMVAGNYSDATMKVEVWQKDMAIIGDFARKLECPTPLFLASASIYTAAMAMGRRSEDTAAVCAVLEKMANYTRPA
jgi:3-hydroxyisobutyrate dehydrogenase-like beta-hydroxyacid dehydrogenase